MLASLSLLAIRFLLGIRHAVDPVAMMLVVLGFLSLRGEPSAVTDSNARPLIVGTVHGLAGTGGVMAVGSPLLADPGWAMLSLLLFGVGTIAGMMLVTVAMRVPALYRPGRFQRARGWLRYASAVVSVGFGLVLAHRVGFVDGLFLTTAR